MKRIGLVVAVLLVIALTACFAAPGIVYAKSCGHGKMKDYEGDTGDMVCKKAEMMRKNKDKLGLSSEQTEEIKALKADTQKNMIKINADINIVDVDIKSEMHKNKIDKQAVNKLIDKKYELKKEKAKSGVEALTKLKDILTEEQHEKLKELYKGCKKDKPSRKKK